MTIALPLALVLLASAFVAGGLLGSRVTKRKLEGEAAELDATRRRLEAFFTHVPIAMSIHTLDGRFAYASREVAEKYGIPLDVLHRTPMDELAGYWENYDEFRAATKAIRRSDKAAEFQAKFRHPEGGEQLIFDMTIFPIRGSDGQLVGTGAVAADVTAETLARHDAEMTRQQLEAFFEHAPVGLAIHDPEGRYLYASSVTQQMYGMTDAELKNRSMQSISHIWPDAKEIEEVMHQVAQGEVRRLLKPLHSPGEEEPFYFDVIMFPIRDASGDIVQIGALGSDVTALKRAEAASRQREALLNGLFEHIPADLAIFDADRKLVMVNSSTATRYGLTPDDLLGTAPGMFRTHWDDYESFAKAGSAMMRSGIAQRLTASFRLPTTGETVIYDTIFFPIRSEDGAIARIGLFQLDITKQVEAERALEEQREQGHQSEKLAALGQLLAGVAHELNNPLTVVVGRSSILAEKFRGTPQEKALNEIREAAERCNRIVKTFLAMARQSAPRRSGVQLNDTIEAASEMVAYNLRSQGVELVHDLDPDLPAVLADEDQLVQVFTNLLINAGHALEDREDEPRITVTSRRSEKKAIVEFRDNGPGVPDEVASRIFEPFFTTKKVGEGTGMGLSMAKGLIEEHGGSLTYRPAPGGGAMFSIQLPLTEELAQAAAPETAAPEHEATGSGARVLIVDDEPAIRSMLSEILAKVGMDCTQSGNGAEALEALSADRFDLVFCDVRMPVMDGMRFRQHLVEERPDMLDRLIYMSGDVLQRSGERYAPIASHAIIDKPFRPSEVRELALATIREKGLLP